MEFICTFELKQDKSDMQKNEKEIEFHLAQHCHACTVVLSSKALWYKIISLETRIFIIIAIINIIIAVVIVGLDICIISNYQLISF